LTENGTKETNFRYSNGLVVEKRWFQQMTLPLRRWNTTSKIISLKKKSTDSKGLFNTTTQTFDKYHNPITIKNFANKIKHSDYNEYDYKINS
jgi:hypothetical protein